MNEKRQFEMHKRKSQGAGMFGNRVTNSNTEKEPKSNWLILKAVLLQALILLLVTPGPGEFTLLVTIPCLAIVTPVLVFVGFVFRIKDRAIFWTILLVTVVYIIVFVNISDKVTLDLT